MTIRDTVASMARAVSVRLDDEALRALRVLEDAGATRSEAIRGALIAAAARRRNHDAIRAEVAALDADEGDRSEMAAVASLMEAIRAPG
jgi:Arc/MetJ-type ribon-helix-helix transcriptional regulator